jgi:hypothetical protein
VNVTYADINNSALLIEIARRKQNYLPDLSFGTHFFQDLVEASIRYIPLYPDDPGIRFHEAFLLGSENILPELLPDAVRLASTIRVIDVPRSTGGLILRVLTNADDEEGVGFLASPSVAPDRSGEVVTIEPEAARAQSAEHWRWRQQFAELLAGEMEAERFGVKGIYLFGSTKNATAGPASDIDLIVHFAGTPGQRRELEMWLDGWSRCLAEMNFLRTGHRTAGLLDVHIVTDEDLARRDSYAVKIGAITDPARRLWTH